MVSSLQDSGRPEIHLIGDLVHCVGLEPKTVRFYEKAGLIKPLRVGSYRMYSDRDIELLKVIKFLRALDISIRIIKGLLERHGRLCMDSLPSEAKSAIERQLQKREEEYRNIEMMCRPILKEEGSLPGDAAVHFVGRDEPSRDDMLNLRSTD